MRPAGLHGLHLLHAPPAAGLHPPSSSCRNQPLTQFPLCVCSYDNVLAIDASHWRSLLNKAVVQVRAAGQRLGGWVAGMPPGRPAMPLGQFVASTARLHLVQHACFPVQC